MQSQNPQSRKADILVVELDGEVLIYDQKINKAFNLNQTSALIWELCDGQKSLSEISRLLGEKLNAEVDDGLVWLALEQLRQENLIENEVALPESLAGLSRRQVIRKVGLAAAITLPFISSLVAPTAMHAQSTPLQPGPAPRRVVPTSPTAPFIPVAPTPLGNPTIFVPLAPVVVPSSPRAPFIPVAPSPLSNPIDEF
jgi:hypothetical protein